MNKKGLLITLEGVEGAGKSTAVQGIKAYLEAQYIPVMVTREPGGTEIAEQIRAVLLADYTEKMVPETEALLMFASRIQHLQHKIMPALNQGYWVISDRFTDASYAYQGGGRGLGLARIEQLKHWVLGDFVPDLTLLFDLPLSLSRERTQHRPRKDRIEQEKDHFFLHVREMYLHLAEQNPVRYRIIDAKQARCKVKKAIEQYLQEVIEQWQA